MERSWLQWPDEYGIIQVVLTHSNVGHISIIKFFTVYWIYCIIWIANTIAHFGIRLVFFIEALLLDMLGGIYHSVAEGIKNSTVTLYYDGEVPSDRTVKRDASRVRANKSFNWAVISFLIAVMLFVYHYIGVFIFTFFALLGIAAQYVCDLLLFPCN